VLGGVLVLLCSLVARNWKDLELLLVVTLASFTVRAMLAVGRNVLGVVAEKDAGFSALDLFHKLQDLFSGRSVSFRWLNTFMFQTLANMPGFLFAGPTQNVVLLTNAFFGAVVAIPVYYYLSRVGARPAIWGVILFSAYPAAVNFSLFGLRDVIIYALVTTYALSVLSFTMLPDRKPSDLAIAATMCVLVLWQRAELIAIMLFMPGLLMAYLVWRAARNERTRAGRTLLIVGGMTAILSAAAVVAGAAGRVISAQLGAEALTVSNVATVYTEKRLERSLSGKGDSNILPRNVYVKMDPVSRTLLQTGGIIVLPYPWLIDSASRLFAAVDSLILITLLFIAYRYSRKERQRSMWAALLTFGLGVLMLGLIVSNAGNAFRMRLALVPFVLGVAALALGEVSFRRDSQFAKRVAMSSRAG
jgi:hypothetical protein